MIKKIDFNCDLGEGFGPYRLGYDAEIMPHITSANIACGFHSGDPVCMNEAVNLAQQNEVGIGAHVGFPDLMGFGRRNMSLSIEEIRSYTIYQIGALQAFTMDKKLQHVKPHGALYNMGAADEKLARVVAEAIKEVDPGLILVGLAGSAWIKAGHDIGLKVASEVFADRALNPDGTLASRSQPNSVIHEISEVLERTKKMVIEGIVIASNGKEIEFKGDTISLHSDTIGAVQLAKELRQNLEAVGITVAPLSTFL